MLTLEIAIQKIKQLSPEKQEQVFQLVETLEKQTEDSNISPQHNLNQIAGKITAFNNIDAVTWQQEIREEWDETRLSP